MLITRTVPELTRAADQTIWQRGVGAASASIGIQDHRLHVETCGRQATGSVLSKNALATLVFRFDELAPADLQSMLAQTEAAIAWRRVEKLKIVAKVFAQKLDVSGSSVREWIDALKLYLRIEALTAASSKE